VRLDPSAARPLLNFGPVQRRWRVSPDAWWPKPPCVPGFASPSSFPSRRLAAPSGICFSHAVTALSHAVAAHRVQTFRAFPALVALDRFPVHCPLDITSSEARQKMDLGRRWELRGATRCFAGRPATGQARGPSGPCGARHRVPWMASSGPDPKIQRPSSIPRLTPLGFSTTVGGGTASVLESCSARRHVGRGQVVTADAEAPA
jgi:hypothetical protein